MVGGGSRRDEGSMTTNNTNVFAALETLRRKKKSDKEGGSSKSKGSSKAQTKEPGPQVFWVPAPVTKKWADEDEDDDDYLRITAPFQWDSSGPSQEKPTHLEESESEEDIFDEGDDEVEEDNDHETEVPGIFREQWFTSREREGEPSYKKSLFEKGSVINEEAEQGFMSAGFELVLIGALLKLWLSSFISSLFLVLCNPLLLCCFQQSTHQCFSSASMRLRPERTCSGVVCFCGFHIKRFFYLFLFLRGPIQPKP